MAQNIYPALNPSLSEVKEQFKIWRKTRKSPWPIPEKLWQAAVKLSANHSVSQIAEELVVDYKDLKKACTNRKKVRKKPPPPTFIELDLEPPAAMSECIVEMQDIHGAKMRMHFRGETDFDLLQLAKAFWSKGL
jgi:DNA-directed RNA polymerase specialized sigma54-like protein